MINEDEASFWDDALNQVKDGRVVEVSCHLKQTESKYCNVELQGFLVQDSSTKVPKYSVWSGYCRSSALVKPSDDEEQVFCRICETQIPISIFQDHSNFCAQFANCESNYQGIQQDLVSLQEIILEKLEQAQTLERDDQKKLMVTSASNKIIQACRDAIELDFISNFSNPSLSSFSRSIDFSHSAQFNEDSVDQKHFGNFKIVSTTDSDSKTSFARRNLKLSMDFNDTGSDDQNVVPPLLAEKQKYHDIISWKCPRIAELDLYGLLDLGITLERLITEKTECMRCTKHFMKKLSELSFDDSPQLRKLTRTIADEAETNSVIGPDRSNSSTPVSALALSGMNLGNEREPRPNSGSSTPERSRAYSLSKGSYPNSPLHGGNRKISFSSANVMTMSPSIAGSSSYINIGDFDVIKPISKGAYGRVYLAKKKRTGDYYAIKVLCKADLIAKNLLNSVIAEQSILASLDSPFVVKLYYSFQSKNNLYLVLEYLNGGDCASLLKAVGTLDEEWAKTYLAEILLGLEVVHKKGIIHGDLKPDNFLIDNRGHIKITDFGLSRLGYSEKTNEDTASISTSPNSILSGINNTVSLSNLTSNYGSGLSPTAGKTGDQDKQTQSNTLVPPNEPRTIPSSKSVSSATEYLPERRNSIIDTLSAGGRINRRISEIRGISPLRNASFSSGTGSPGTTQINTNISSISSIDLMNKHEDPDSPISDKGNRAIGTPDYMSPEQILGNTTPNYLADYWSLGAIAFEFLFGIPPFHDDSAEAIFDKISMGIFEFPEEPIVSDDAKNFISSLLKINPNDRPTTTNSIKDHPFFSDIDWNTIYFKDSLFVPQTENIDDTVYFDGRGIKPFSLDLDMDNQTVSKQIGNFDEGMGKGTNQINSDTTDSRSAPRTGAIFNFDDTDPNDSSEGYDTGDNSIFKSEVSYQNHHSSQLQNQLSVATSASLLSSLESFTYRNLQLLEKANRDAFREKKAKSNILSKPRISVSISNGIESVEPVTPTNETAPTFNICSTLSCNASDNENSRVFSVTKTTDTVGIKPFFTEDTKDGDKNIPSIAGNTAISPHASKAGLDPISPKDTADPISVLVVEDNPISAIVLEALLRRRNCVVTVARDGLEALRLTMEVTKFDLILLDIHLPGGLNGDTIARIIKVCGIGINASTPIVATTGFGDLRINSSKTVDSDTSSKNPAQDSQFPFNAVLHKPITQEKLETVIEGKLKLRLGKPISSSKNGYTQQRAQAKPSQ